MSEKKKKNNFLKIPEYPGGKEALREFIAQNLRYPQQAVNKKTEGVVQLKIEINYTGAVCAAVIERGLGDGCNEEALRIADLLQFGAVKNRGLRIKASKRIKIHFKLPKQQKISINYHITPENKRKTSTPIPQSINLFSYTISLKK